MHMNTLRERKIHTTFIKRIYQAINLDITKYKDFEKIYNFLLKW